MAACRWFSIDTFKVSLLDKMPDPMRLAVEQKVAENPGKPKPTRFTRMEAATRAAAASAAAEAALSAAPDATTTSATEGAQDGPTEYPEGGRPDDVTPVDASDDEDDVSHLHSS